ncbi:hypothetical protein Plec18170_000218 [Paecilomyces lecythidis]
MNKARFDIDGDPIFYIPEIDIPISCPPYLSGNLKARYVWLARQFHQLRHIWEVQLKNHRDYWNVKASYDFWCENGTMTIHGRDFGWSEQWVIDAMDEVRYDLHKLEEFAQFIRAARADIRERYLYSISIPIVPDDEDSSTVHMSELAESDIEPSPTHMPARRRLQNQEIRQSTASDVGSRHHPIVIVHDSEDERDGRRRDPRTPVTPIRRANYGHRRTHG